MAALSAVYDSNTQSRRCLLNFPRRKPRRRCSGERLAGQNGDLAQILYGPVHFVPHISKKAHDRLCRCGLLNRGCLLSKLVVISLLRLSLATTIIGKPLISGKP
jgi:hypothetical protein